MLPERQRPYMLDSTLVPSVSIVVPTYREADNLPILTRRLAATLRPLGWVWEVIIVDDNSPDATPAVLEQLRKQYPEFNYRIRTNERGLSSAVLAGISLARHDYVLVMDADLSHPPESVPELIKPLAQGQADYVIGSRYVTGGRTEDWGFLRWLNSYGATLLSRPLIGAVRDPMAGFFALRRNTLGQAAALNPVGYKISLELMVKCGTQRVHEVPIVFRNRLLGESKLTMGQQMQYLQHLARLYQFRFPRLVRGAYWALGSLAGVTLATVFAGLLWLMGVADVIVLSTGMALVAGAVAVLWHRQPQPQTQQTRLPLQPQAQPMRRAASA